MNVIHTIIKALITFPKLSIILILSLLYILKIVNYNETSLDSNWNKGDAIFYHFMADSLLEDGDLDLSNNHGELPLYDGFFAMSKSGYITAKQSPMMTIVSLPLRYIFGPVGSMWFNVLCSIGIVLLLYELLILWVSKFSALIASLLVAFGSVLLEYAVFFSPDVFSCFLVLGLLVAVIKQKWLYIGFLASMAISLKIGNIIVVLPILGYLLFQFSCKEMRRNFKNYVLVGVSFIITILPFTLYNYCVFGSPFTTGYQAILTMDTNGVLIVSSHTSDFNLPFIKGMWRLLFNQRNGLFMHNWFVASIALIGVFLIPKKNLKVYILILIIIGIQLIFYALYDYQLATLFGNRFLLISIALFAVPISFVIESMKNRLIRKYKLAI